MLPYKSLNTLPDENSSPTWSVLDTNLLLCSLFTLVPNDELFKELNLSKYYYSNQLNGDLFLTDPKYLSNLFLALNKPLIRQLSYSILQPLFEETSITTSNTSSIKINFIEHELIRKYLKKFRHFYKLFFLKTSALNNYQITEKEINYFAVKFLFILIGI